MEESNKDPFESVFMFENVVSDEGFKLGFNDGRRTGINEGLSAGRHKGVAIGKEIGYCYGFCLSALNILESTPSFADKHHLKNMNLLKQFLFEVDKLKTSDETMAVEVANKIDELRCVFKKIQSCLHLKYDIVKSECDGLAF